MERQDHRHEHKKGVLADDSADPRKHQVAAGPPGLNHVREPEQSRIIAPLPHGLNRRLLIVAAVQIANGPQIVDAPIIVGVGDPVEAEIECRQANQDDGRQHHDGKQQLRRFPGWAAPTRYDDRNGGESEGERAGKRGDRQSERVEPENGQQG